MLYTYWTGSNCFHFREKKHSSKYPSQGMCSPLSVLKHLVISFFGRWQELGKPYLTACGNRNQACDQDLLQNTMKELNVNLWKVCTAVMEELCKLSPHSLCLIKPKVWCMHFIQYMDCITSCIRCCKVTCVNNNWIVRSRAGEDARRDLC